MGFTVSVMGHIFLLFSVIKLEFLMLTVIYEITVKCYNTPWILNLTNKTNYRY